MAARARGSHSGYQHMLRGGQTRQWRTAQADTYFERTWRQPPDPALATGDEGYWQVKLEWLFIKSGWRVQHANITSLNDTPGWPDLVVAHPLCRVLQHAEVKTDSGRLSEEQRVWAEVLWATGHPVQVWRPRDWPVILQMAESGDTSRGAHLIYIPEAAQGVAPAPDKRKPTARATQRAKVRQAS